MKEYIKNVLSTFCFVNTGSMLGSALFISIFYGGHIEYSNLLWEIASLSLIIAIVNNILFSKDQLNKKEFAIRKILQYVFINIVIIGGGYLFERIDNSINQIIGLMIIILGVYGFIFFATYRNDSKVAEKLNEKISEYNKKE